MKKWNWQYPIGAVGLWLALSPANVSAAMFNLKDAKVVSSGKNTVAFSNEFYSVKLTDGSWSQPLKKNVELVFRDRAFDPTVSAPAEMKLSARASNDSSKKLFIVQFHTQALDGYRQELTKLGTEIHQYLPNQAFLVRATESSVREVQKLGFVRWVGSLPSSYKMDTETKNWLASNDAADGARRFNIVVVDRSDRDRLMGKIQVAGGKIAHANNGSMMFEADLDTNQVQFIAAQSETLWMDPWSEITVDVDNARALGGANYLQGFGENKFTGLGIRGHVMEGIDPTHQDFAENEFRKAPINVSKAEITGHGHNTYGIIFGSGKGKAQARGIIPNAQGYYTPYSYVYSAAAGNKEVGSRYELVGRLVKEHNVMFQTASWGYSQTTKYDARSLEMDDLIFTFDIPITQSQSNMGSTASRPQAWAKNIISVGALEHYDNADPEDDKWNSGGSIGPAEDGRIKPDISAFYDDILTTDLSNGYTESFGGTSGATPIIAGHVGLTLEMWTNGDFSNELKAPVSERFKNRPHFTTVKALLINQARQWKFKGATEDRTRVHQGWGFPNTKGMYDNRNKMLIVNQEEALINLATKAYTVKVAANTPELKATMVYPDPPGNLTSKITRVNDLTLKVTSPDGTIYYGNNGLLENMYSVAGGQPNTVDTVENVFVEKPAAGVWKVEILASEVNQDGHLATSEVDAVYSLVVSGIGK